MNCQSDNQTSSCHDSQFGCCPDGTTENTLGACNSSSENLTIIELSNNSTDSNLQSADNSSDVTASWMNDSYSSYPADLNYGMALTTADQESASGDMKDDDNITSDLTVSRYDDKNLSTSDLSHDNTSTPNLSDLNLGENGTLTPPSIHLTSEQVGPCSAAPYGCCPDGITAAMGPDKASCLVATTTPRQKPGRVRLRCMYSILCCNWYILYLSVKSSMRRTNYLDAFLA